VGFTLPFPIAYFFSIRQEYEGHVQQFRIFARLGGGFGWVDAAALGFNHRQGAAMPVTQNVIRAEALLQHVFKAQAGAIRDLPANIGEEGIYLGAGEGFVCHQVCPKNRSDSDNNASFITLFDEFCNPY
jgi:hypothetical protein